MGDAAVPEGSGGRYAAAQAGAGVPAVPVIGLSERDIGAPCPLLDALKLTIGWHFRRHAEGGPAYVILRRRTLGSFRVVASFPLTEDGWSSAWQFFVAQNPAAVPEMLTTLKAREAEAAREDVERGLVLLALQAQAADHRTLGWVKRRVELLEILDTRAVRWRVSVDFEVPIEAPIVYVGSDEFRLIPIMTLPKGDLVSFDLRDEHGAALWLPTSDENNRRLAPALVVSARRVLRRNALPGTLEQDLMQIAATLSSEHKEAYKSFAAAAASIAVKNLKEEVREASRHLYEDRFWHVRERWRAGRNWRQSQDAWTAALATERADNQALGDLDKDVRDAAYQLMADRRFRSLLEELAQNYIVNVAIPMAPLARRVVKLTSERTVTFWSRKKKWRKLLQLLGWQCWPLRVLIGGSGGSHHLEVAAPPGVDVVRIVARPAQPPHPDEPGAPVLRTAGFSPHVHMSIPARSPLRYRATIYVRTSRGGWLFASLLVGILIAVVMMLGRHYLPTLFHTSNGAASGEAGTAATLLLALLGVIALWLIRPGEHPLASRLLFLVRALILIGVADVLFGTGDLVLHQTTGLPFTLWSVLAWVSVGIAVMLALSWLMPRKLPWRSGNRGGTGYASEDGGANR
jgi:hypothetical protein